MPIVCEIRLGAANMDRKGRFSFQLFSRNVNVWKLPFDPSESVFSHSIVLVLLNGVLEAAGR